MQKKKITYNTKMNIRTQPEIYLPEVLHASMSRILAIKRKVLNQSMQRTKNKLDLVHMT